MPGWWMFVGLKPEPPCVPPPGFEPPGFEPPLDGLRSPPAKRAIMRSCVGLPAAPATIGLSPCMRIASPNAGEPPGERDAPPPAANVVSGCPEDVQRPAARL